MKAKSSNRTLFYTILCLCVVYVIGIYPTPYVILQPGSVTEIHDLVTVDQGDELEEGSLNMVTVSMDASVNGLQLVYALLHPYLELSEKQNVFREGESKADYFERQKYQMSSSHSHAIMAAYNQAGIAYEVITEEIRVDYVYPDSPNQGILEIGDQLLTIDGISIQGAEDLAQALSNKEEGEKIQVEVKRDEQPLTRELILAEAPGVSSVDRLGVSLSYLQSVKPQNDAHEVHIKMEDVGGPSAGFMFAMEIYNQLTEGDLTKGYRIVGTGTINADGQIGVIGGIEHKVLAADREGADIFFAPKDYIPPEGSSYAPILNYSAAKQRADEIDSDMEIVPVGTMGEAIEYLQQLPDRK